MKFINVCISWTAAVWGASVFIKVQKLCPEKRGQNKTQCWAGAGSGMREGNIKRLLTKTSPVMLESLTSERPLCGRIYTHFCLELAHCTKRALWLSVEEATPPSPPAVPVCPDPAPSLKLATSTPKNTLRGWVCAAGICFHLLLCALAGSSWRWAVGCAAQQLQGKGMALN